MGSRKCHEAYLSRAGLGQLGVQVPDYFPAVPCGFGQWQSLTTSERAPLSRKVDGGSPRPRLAVRPQCVTMAMAGSEWPSCTWGVGTSAGPALAFL